MSLYTHLMVIFLVINTCPAWAGEIVVPREGKNFIAEAKLLYRVVACAGNDRLPAYIDSKIVEEHCHYLAPKMRRYKQRYIGEAKKFIAMLRPSNLPHTVVYPFGGGDLISVLTTYPDATDITTLSLEHAGDPRRLNKIGSRQLGESLRLFRRIIWGLLMADNSTTENLQRGQRGEIPGELGFFLVALAEHGYEPVSLRYFKLNPDGTLHYLSEQEIAEQEKVLAKTLRGRWAPPGLSVAFSNMELAFKPINTNKGPIRIHRHFAANLANSGLQAEPALAKYLENKGNICAMTKAASYLLWRDEFAQIRDYLLRHMQFMLSDSTGIPPKYLARAGFAPETYGKFSGSFLAASEEHNRAFRLVWNSQPRRRLPFRYGYIDANGSYHMLVTRKL